MTKKKVKVGLAPTRRYVFSVEDAHRYKKLVEDKLREWEVEFVTINSELTAMGPPVACETDILGALASVLLMNAAETDSPTFFADITVRHPENDSGELGRAAHALYEACTFIPGLKPDPVQPTEEEIRACLRWKDLTRGKDPVMMKNHA